MLTHLMITACLRFREGFDSPHEMSSSAFNIISTASASQRYADDLLLLLKDLGMTKTFRPYRLRQQLLAELSRIAKSYLPSSNLSSRPIDNTFSGFEKLSRASVCYCWWARYSVSPLHVNCYWNQNSIASSRKIHIFARLHLQSYRAPLQVLI